MKLPLFALGLGITVMVVLGVHAFRQELRLRDLRSRISQSSVDSQNKEGDIADMKRKVIEQKAQLETVQSKLDELKAQKAELEKSKSDSETNLKSCAEEKARLRYADMAGAVFVIYDCVTGNILTTRRIIKLFFEC